MSFGQLVIGPPGSGKSTYCDGMLQFMTAIERPCVVVNLDPANDAPSYGKAAIDIRDMITLDEVMSDEQLGPNGGMLYALEELECNFEWLEERLKAIRSDDYILFDCPGQVELYTNHSSMRNIFRRLEKAGYRLVVIHLLDCYVLTQPSLYISSLLLALRSMLQMELPHINVLTKLDNLASYPALPFNLDFYTEVQDLQYLIPHMAKEPLLFPGQRSASSGRKPRSGAEAEQATTASIDHTVSDDIDMLDGLENNGDDDDAFFDPDDPAVRNTPRARLVRLTRTIANLVDDYSLLSFHTLAVEDRTSMAALLRAIDLAIGYVFVPSANSSKTQTDGGKDSSSRRGRDPSAPNEAALWSSILRDDKLAMDIRDVQERWIDRKDEMDELERKAWEREAGVVPPNPANEKLDIWNPTKKTDGSATHQQNVDSDEMEANARSTPTQGRPPLDDFPDLDDDEALAEAIATAKQAGKGTKDGVRVNGVTVVRKYA